MVAADGFASAGIAWRPPLRPKVITTYFDQRSTRTRLGFQVAAARLGHHAIDAYDTDRGRMGDALGESFEDHVRTIALYSDLMVVRSKEEGLPAKIAAISSVPVINGGNGGSEHPTQALVDLFAIRRLRGDVTTMDVALSADTRARFALSFVKLLALTPPRRLTVCVDPRLGVAPAMEAVLVALRAAGTAVSVVHDVAEVLSHDVVNIQMQDQSAFANAGTGSDAIGSWSEAEPFRLTAEKVLASGSDCLILNPMPRFSEVCPSVDALPNAGYFDQAVC